MLPSQNKGLHKQLNKDEFYSLSEYDQMLYYCLTATLAPNSHNTQPWKFRIENRTITILLNTSAILTQSDKSGKQAVISIGCALENIIISSSYMGEITKYEFLEESNQKIDFENVTGDLLPILQVSFSKQSKRNSVGLYKFIFSRKSIRTQFQNGSHILDTVIDELLSEAAPEDSLKLYCDQQDISRIAELQHQADSYVINDPAFSTELGNWLLPNETERLTGMPGFTFGLSDKEASRIHMGLLQVTSLNPSDTLKMGLAGKTGIEKSSLIGVIFQNEDSIESWVNSGQKLQRSLLILESHSIQCSIYAGIIEVPLLKRMLETTFESNKTACALFRAGFVQNENDLNIPQSPRQPVRDLVVGV